ncbi:MAG: ribonuclease HII [Firmicutes bacterium]|nr:ribonuclease HII [Bacillota bacterium]
MSETVKYTPDYTFERAAAAEGFTAVCGVDEAGRGPLAGPVVAAAVILPDGCVIDGLNDSKKLSEKKRELLYETITERATAYGIAEATVEEIERYNILGATFLAMCRAVDALGVAADYALIDGNKVPPQLGIPAESIIKGDARSCSVAAASILAKVTRDRELYQLDKLYPQYGFAKHKGYGTKAHTDAILQYGPCPEHRPSFLKKLMGGGK